MKKYTILIVDDEVENLNLLANILSPDYFVHRARDGATALALLRDQEFHMILTDQRMPGMSGVELLEKARDLRPDGVRILVTAFPDAQNAIEAINRGQVRRYISKPFDPAELRTILLQEFEHLDLVLANRRLNEKLGRLIDDLFKANRKLQELNLMKDQFLANCSHELKTPLVSGMGYLDLILSGGLGKSDPRQEKGLKIAHRNMERLLGLIENLLALTKARYRPEKLRAAAFDLRALVDECVDSLQTRARPRKKSIRVKVLWPRKAFRVEGDEQRIHSVFTNVLANSEKFTPDHARIEVRVAVAKGKVSVTVTDNGAGPDRSQREIQLFKTTSDPRTAGLGIGLMLARQILQAHGCDIALERGRGGGGVVRFDLPLAKE